MPQTSIRKFHRHNKAYSATGRFLLKRKLLLYFVMTVAFIAVFAVSFKILDYALDKKLRPQIARAIIQVSNLLPQLESNEKALRNAYETMNERREKFLEENDYTVTRNYYIPEKKLDLIVNDTISWLDRVSKLKVGRDGYTFVVSKESNRILSHPEAKYLGDRIRSGGFDDEARIGLSTYVRMEDISSSTDPESLDLETDLFRPDSMLFKSDVDELGVSVYGAALEYKDYYIICGIPVYEYIYEIIVPSLFISLLFAMGMWLYIKYIGFTYEEHAESRRRVKGRFVSFAVFQCVFLFLFIWYYIVLDDVTGDLKTMEMHAGSAVETLDTYEVQRDKINNWLDSQYLLQAHLVEDVVNAIGRDNVTRKDLSDIASGLGIKQIFIFDKKGKVICTNSPYDHFELSDDPEEQSYDFRVLLDGVPYVIQDPVENEVIGDYTQYIGISTRNEDDLCDGFIQIGVNPLLRINLTSALNVDTVLSNLIIGLPEHAIAVDKESLRIVSTTGIGFVDQPIEDLGITEDELKRKFNGFLKIKGKTYYAGVSESQDLYLVPVVKRSDGIMSVKIAFMMTLHMMIWFAAVTLIAVSGYKKEELDRIAAEHKKDEDTADGSDVTAISGGSEGTPDEADALKELKDILGGSEKKNFELRWKRTGNEAALKVPERRINRVIYMLLLIICIISLVPLSKYRITGETDNQNLDGLAYVLSGNWEKGVNIFAFSSCVFLLCAMYVFVVLIDRILYEIARVSNTRVETVCHLLKNSIKYVCVIVFIYYGLAQFGIDTRTLLASAGIMSLIIGLGAKDLVNDIIAGFFMIFEGTCKVGDYIYCGDFDGTVQSVGLRTTRVKCFTETKMFNNSSIRDIINTDNYSVRMPVRVPISYEEDINKVEDVLRGEFTGLMDVIPGLMKEPVIEGVVAYEDSCLILRCAIYVVPEVRFPAQREFMKQIKLILDRHGIEIPFSQIVVHQADRMNISDDTIKK